MSFYETITLPFGSAAFEGMVRMDQGGAHVFRVDLPNRFPMYGEWQPAWEANHNDFNVEILNFGSSSKYAVRSGRLESLKPLSPQEATAVRNLVTKLFATPEVRDKVVPFTSTKGQFLGGVTFRNNWVHQSAG